MTKWKYHQLTDKGDTVTDVIDPEAHQEIKSLKTELHFKEESILRNNEELKEIEITINKLEEYIGLLKKDIDIESAKSNLLSDELNKEKIKFNHMTKELKEIREANQSLGKQFAPLSAARNDAVQSERQALKQLDKYKDLVINARRLAWSKDEVRKLKTLIGE